MGHYEEVEKVRKCPRCGWQGLPEEASQEHFRDLFEFYCPRCGEKLGLIAYPTREEIREAAARGDESARVDLMAVEIQEARERRFEIEKLKGPEDLPDLPGDRLHFLWDLGENERGEEMVVLRLGRRILWIELAFWEGYERFNEVREILKQKYGRRFCALAPARGSEDDLFGDCLSAPGRIGLDKIEEAGLAGIYEGSIYRPGFDRTTRFERALAFATRLHAEQQRKGSDVPYACHLLSVAAIALEYGANETEAIAALLHDAVEDQGGAKTRRKIERRFGSEVAKIVEGCSDSHGDPKPPWFDRKKSYLDRIAGEPPSVRLVSAADKLHNVRSILKDYREIGEDLWSRFNGGREGTLWYYGSLVSEFRKAGSNPLVEELARVVSELESLVARDSAEPRFSHSAPPEVREWKQTTSAPDQGDG
jgi:GTP pyrophosphokinase